MLIVQRQIAPFGLQIQANATWVALIGLDREFARFLGQHQRITGAGEQGHRTVAVQVR